MAEFGGVVASHTNSERELLTIERANSEAFAGQLLLVIHDDGPLDLKAPMLLDEGTQRFLRTFLCLRCDGEGYVMEAEHGCAGDERSCAELCPVPVQRDCPSCRPVKVSSPSAEEPF